MNERVSTVAEHIDSSLLADWRSQAQRLSEEIQQVVLGQQHVVHRLVMAVFARGHILLEGDVGVGKTTLLRALAQGLGGGYERLEGTVDLMPADLLYHVFVDEHGRPRVEPGPLLRQGEDIVSFFFNEINRARPQVHALLLRAMAERSVTAFNRHYILPHLLVFADRNRVERDETFELPVATRDRFLMEIEIRIPESPDVQEALVFQPRFHDTDDLIGSLSPMVGDYRQLNRVASAIQRSVVASPALRRYALTLWEATADPQRFGIVLSDVDMPTLVEAGVSPRGMSQLLRAARVQAWLSGRDYLVPEDLQGIFVEIIAHRIVLSPLYQLRQERLAHVLARAILAQIAAP